MQILKQFLILRGFRPVHRYRAPMSVTSAVVAESPDDDAAHVAQLSRHIVSFDSVFETHSRSLDTCACPSPNTCCMRCYGIWSLSLSVFCPRSVCKGHPTPKTTTPRNTTTTSRPHDDITTTPRRDTTTSRPHHDATRHTTLVDRLPACVGLLMSPMSLPTIQRTWAHNPVKQSVTLF